MCRRVRFSSPKNNSPLLTAPVIAGRGEHDEDEAGGKVSASARASFNFCLSQINSPLITAAPSQINAGVEEGGGTIVAMSRADGQVRVRADDIFFCLKLTHLC